MKKELRVLILEDVAADAELLERELRKEKMKFVSKLVDTKNAFTKALKDFKPDIILSDYMMPQFTGMDALEIVKEKYPTIPVIIVTGSMNEETAVECMKAGASDYVIKEHIVRIGSSVKSALEKKRIIDEKKRVDKALINAGYEWKTTLDAMNDAVCLLDFDGKILRGNVTLRNMLGKPFKEIIGHRNREFFNNLVKPNEVCPFERMKETRIRESLAVQLNNRWLTITVDPLMDDDNNIIGGVQIISDITERKQSEKRIKHLNSLLRAVRNVNQLIAKEKDRDRLLKGACKSLNEIHSFNYAWIALMNESGKLVCTAEAGLGKKFLPLIKLLKRGELPVCAQKALAQSEVVLIKDYSTCNDCPLVGGCVNCGAMSVRLVHQGKVYGLLTVSLPIDAVSDEDEQNLLNEVAGDIAFGLYSMELEEERNLQDTRQRALQKVRDSIWNMQNQEDIKKVIYAVRESLEELRVPFRNSGLNVVDDSKEPPEVHSYIFIGNKEKILTVSEKGKCVITQIWRKGAPQYRKDIHESDNYDELENIENLLNDTVRSVIDVPFSHGTLAVSSPEPDAFSERDMSILKEMAQVVSEGFKRTEDLRNLEKYTKELESEIAERKKGAEALRESEKRYRDIFNNAAVSIWEENFSEVKEIIDELKAKGVTDFKKYLNDHPEIVKEAYLTPKKLDVNDMTLKLYGARTKEELLVPYGKHMVSKTFEWFHEFMISIAEEKEYFESETVNQTIDGRMIDVRIRINIPNEAEQFKNMLLIVTDITDRKKAEEARIRLEAAIEQAAESIVITRSDGIIQYVNPAFEKITGYTREEAIGQNPRILKSGKHDEAFYKTMWNTISSGKMWKGHFINKKKDGTIFDEEASISPINDSTENIVNYVAVKRNVTNELKNESRFREAQKMEAIGTLAGGIAHDFNNFLGVVLGYLSIAKLDLDPKDELYNLLTEAENAGKQATNLTKQLLTFSKGGAPIITTVHIKDIIKQSAKFSLRGSNVKCKYDIPDDLWPADVDEGQLNQVINNLAINAVHAMPGGGIINIRAENVTVGSELHLPLNEGEYVKISIEDHGAGISKENLSKIFDPYFTTKETGTGLGLATSYSIIKKHNGYISVESELGVGTTFHIYLPASREKVVVEKKAEEKIITGEGKILVMDDERGIRNSVKRMMRRLGYRAEFAEDGFEAIELYRRAQESGNPFDAVIMDLTVPGGMGGKEATEILLKLDPEAKVIVSSGYFEDSVMAKFKQHGFKGIIAKPYQIEELSRVIYHIINETDI